MSVLSCLFFIHEFFCSCYCPLFLSSFLPSFLAPFSLPFLIFPLPPFSPLLSAYSSFLFSTIIQQCYSFLLTVTSVQKSHEEAKKSQDALDCVDGPPRKQKQEMVIHSIVLPCKRHGPRGGRGDIS